MYNYIFFSPLLGTKGFPMFRCASFILSCLRILTGSVYDSPSSTRENSLEK